MHKHLSPKTRLGLIFLILSSTFAVNAQDGQLQGSIRDAENEQPLEFANVSLLAPGDSSLLQGTLSGLSGEYELSAAEGEYLLRFSFIGYEASFRTVRLQAGEALNLPPVLLAPDAKTLDEVTVTSVRSMFKSDIDKRVYDVENSVIAQGGTAIDLLQTLPSIQVDEEGNISMRGSGNILILINGRPSSVSSEEMESILAQFPANSVKSVELITNPSSRYDAAGIGGIINIVLKKDERQGLNGQAEASVGTREKYSGGINLNYGLPKVNFFANYNYQYRRLFELSESQRFATTGRVSPQLDQNFDTDNIRQNQLLRAGLDYRPAEALSLGFYVQYNANSRERLRIYEQLHRAADGQRDSLSVRTLNEDQRATNIEAGFNLNWDIDSSGQALLFNASYSRDEQERVEFFDQLYYYGSDEQPGRREDQIYGRPHQRSLAVLQLDYLKPFGAFGKLEAGLKSTIADFDNRQFFEQLDPQGVWIDNDTISNRFQFNESVHAAYMMYRSTIGQLGVQAGLRSELTLTQSFEFNTERTVTNNYFNLFPSLYLSYELATEATVMLNYSRRISRPSVGALAPFYNAQDFLNLRLGNPLLQPELTDSYELGYAKSFDWLFFTGTLYHRRTTDLLSRIYVLFDNNFAVQTWENANRRNANGLELINQLFLAKWMDLTLSGNFFHSRIIADNISEELDNENFSWTISLLSSFRAGKWGNFQLQGDYRGPIVLPQGEIAPMYGLNIGYRKNLWDGKATLGLNVSDVFNTRIFVIETTGQGFSQERVFNWESQIATLTFTYRFGGFNDQAREERGGGNIDSDPF